MRTLVLLVAIGVPSLAHGQAMITLEGIVRDDVRGIAGAEVSAVDSLTNERRTAVSSERGFFRMLDLSPGRYVVSARAVGHTPAIELVHLVVGQRMRLEIVLQRTAVTLETVLVQERPGSSADIQRMSVSTAVTEQEIRNLPLNTRHMMELAAVTPGIRSFRPVAGRSLPGRARCATNARSTCISTASR